MKRAFASRSVHGVPTRRQSTNGWQAGPTTTERARIVNWNVSNPPTGFLFRLEGDYRRFRTRTG